MLLERLQCLCLVLRIDRLFKVHVSSSIVKFQHECSDELQVVLLLQDAEHTIHFLFPEGLLLPDCHELVFSAQVPLGRDNPGFY